MEALAGDMNVTQNFFFRKIGRETIFCFAQNFFCSGTYIYYILYVFTLYFQLIFTSCYGLLVGLLWIIRLNSLAANL